MPTPRHRSAPAPAKGCCCGGRGSDQVRMKPAHQSEQRVSSLEEKLFLSRYSNSPLDDIDADFSSIRPNMPPHWRVAWMLGQEAPGGASAPRAARNGGESHERLRSRKLRHRDDRREDHQHGSAAAGVRTARPLSTMNLCVRPVGHARVLRGLRSMWIATLRTSFLAPSPHVSRMSVGASRSRPAFTAWRVGPL